MAIIIDPSLSILNLAQVVGICKDNPRDTVLTCLSPIQQKYLSQKISNNVKCLGIDWPVRERMDSSASLYSYWDKLEKLEEAKINPWPSIFPYEVNVAKIYRYYLANEGRLFWSVLKILTKTKSQWQEHELIAVGKDPMFFAALEFITSLFNSRILFKHVIRKRKINLSSVVSKGKALFRALKNECVLQWARKTRKRLLYVDKHRQTEPVVQLLREHKDVLVFQNTMSLLQKLSFKTPFYHQANMAAEACRKLMERLIETNPFQDKSFPWMATLKAFVRILEPRLRNVMYQTFQTWEYFDQVRPVGIVCMNWLAHIHQSMRAWGKGNGAPFFVIQHGIHSGGIVSPIERRVDADYFFCWGTGMKDSFIKADPANAAVIKCTGNPCHDISFYSDFSHVNNNLFPPEPSSILVAPGEHGYLMSDAGADFWHEIESIIRRLPNIKWTIRCHPLFPYKELIYSRSKNLGATISRYGQDSLFDALKNSDLVITTVSSVAVDAMIMKRPLIILNNAKIPELFSQFGAGIVLEKIGELSKVITELLSKGFKDNQLIERQNAFVSMFYKKDATNNIVREIQARLKDLIK